MCHVICKLGVGSSFMVIVYSKGSVLIWAALIRLYRLILHYYLAMACYFFLLNAHIIIGILQFFCSQNQHMTLPPQRI